MSLILLPSPVGGDHGACSPCKLPHPMPKLMHLAPARLERRIQRSGLRGRPWQFRIDAGLVREREAVFSFPVLPDFSMTHQWLRELRRWNGRSRLVAVYFKLDGTELVYAGRFGARKSRVPLTDALQLVTADPWGAEIAVPRAVSATSIVSVREIRQDVGWVATPDGVMHGDESCVCPVCLPSGTPKLMRKLRGQYNRALERIHAAVDDGEVVSALQRMELPLERARGRLSPKKLLSLAKHPSSHVRGILAYNLGFFSRNEVVKTLELLLEDEDQGVQTSAIDSLVRLVGPISVVRRVTARALLIYLADELTWSCDETAEQALEILRANDDEAVRAAAVAGE